MDTQFNKKSNKKRTSELNKKLTNNVNKQLNRKQLVSAISIILSGIASPNIFAQEATNTNGEVEEVVVTGIRASLIQSMDYKRQSNGVVDAITSEDIGKFPDSNLAESLQRIPGVSISRSNGEGSKITVRGLGPDFNLVTLNGRQMPGTGYSRSYELENLSSVGVDALEIIKTARAEQPTGAIGAIVNIKTKKPLDNPGLHYSVSAKALQDTSNKNGDEITPEVAAIFSNTFADDTIGVSLTYSHQDRAFQQQSAIIDGWKAYERIEDEDILGDATGDDAIDNRPTDADGNALTHIFLPQNVNYQIADVERTRDNGQLTLQYAPSDNLTATLDYTASEASYATQSTSFGVWFNFGGNINSYELDENGTAITFNEANNDYAHTVRQSTTLVEAESVGLNIDWQATDNLHFNFDYHDSSNAIDYGADSGSQSSPFVIISPNNLDSKTYGYTSGDIPQIELFWEDGAAEADPSDFDPLFARFDTSSGLSEIQQFQVHGTWDVDFSIPISVIKFGVARTDQKISSKAAGVDQQGPVGYNGNEAIFPDSMFIRHDTGDFLDELAGGGSSLTTNYYYTFDFDEAISRLDAFFPDFETNPYATGGIDEQKSVQEVTTSVYLQAESEFDIIDMPAYLSFGFRYEQTDVTSVIKQRVEDYVVWLNSSEWNLVYEDEDSGFISTSGSHNVFLPSIDLKVDITDDFVLRSSLGKTISRAPLANLEGGRTLSSNPKPNQRSGSSGNTDLQPYESINFDVSAEYYYSEGSYVSLGAFHKVIDNFILNDTSIITVDGLRDPYLGPRAIQAEADLRANNEQVTLEALYAQIIANGGGNAEGQIIQNDDDPLLEWTVTQPLNAPVSRTVSGLEFTLQHMFGKSGFGSAVNFTLSEVDEEYDVDSVQGYDTDEPITVLPGIGDSANLQAFYEKNGLSVKFTYAWRDTYLLGVGQDQGSADNPPQYFKEFGQWDVSINYDVTDELTVFFEGINLNNETEEVYGRYEEQFLSARQYGPRYLIGARYTY